MNQVQFQAWLSMAQFIHQYGTEAKCYRTLYRSRRPQGFRCHKGCKRPRSRFRRAGRVYYQYRACRPQTSLTSGTMFEGIRSPSLSYLKRLPVDMIKVDQMFVSELPQDEGDVLLLSGIIAMAKAPNFGVIAEGVETEEQRVLLCEAGCDIAQGNLFAPPLSAADADAQFAKCKVGQPG